MSIKIPVLHYSYEIFSDEDKLHEIIVSLINKENFEDLIALCQEVVKRDIESKLIQKVIDTLFHHGKYSVIAGILEAYFNVDLKNNYIFDVVNLLISNKEYKTIIKLCDSSLNINPNNHFIQEILYLLIDLDLYNLFLEICTLLLSHNTDIIIILDIVDNLINIREYTTVVKICKIILNYQPFLILRIIRLLSDNGKHKEALLISLDIKKRLPESPEVWNTIGEVFLNKGLYQKALNAFKYSLEFIDPENTWLKCIIWSNIGWCNNKLGQHDNAISACRKSLELNHKYSDSYNNIGYAYYKKGDIDKGIELIEKSIELDQNNNHAWYNLSQIYFKLNDFHEAYNNCYQCLCINNQLEKGINFYRKLYNFPVFRALGLLLSEITSLGYRDIISKQDYKMLKINISRRPKDFISYSLHFQKLIRTLKEEDNGNIIAIYAWLPQCPYCKSVFKVRGYSYDYQNKIRTIIYSCSNGHGKERHTSLKNKNPFIIKTIVLVKSLSPIPIEYMENFKFKKEGISITFRTFDQLNMDLHKATLLYGKE